MEQYIPKSVVVEELKKRFDYRVEGLKAINNDTFWKEEQSEDEFNKVLTGCAYNAAKNEVFELICFIDTLEVKEVNLEEKATQLSQKYFPNEENIWARPNIEAQRCKSACIEIVEWFKAQKGK